MNVSSLGRRLSVLLLAGAALSGTAHAATQGNLGATSTGSVVINATVAPQVRISGLEDVSFNNPNPANNAFRAQNVCVWSNTATRNYKIEAVGNGGTSTTDLSISDGTTAIPYSVEWDDVSGATSGAALASGVQVGGQNSTATKSDCSGGGETASLIVRIAATDLQDMQAAASYTGTLTLTVTPE